MQSKISSGTPVVKKHYYVELAGRFGRTWKAFEYRMQNISYVIALRGRAWIPGLVPAKHVGSKTAAKIEEFLGAHETTLEGNEAAFEVQVAEAFRRLRSKPAGRLSPTAVATVSLQFVRDPEVKAWVLRNAEGVCECCQQQAPFESISGPFLEVHHVQRLADKGADTVENAIAICPNCHRRLHYALNAAELIDQIYARIGRLIRKHDATTTSTPSSDLELGHL
ncbi:MAG: HNH endonuclease [Sphingomonadales bacterium]|nr:MAG: HNH endonuclease [Sphingomonadales bacterium]